MGAIGLYPIRMTIGLDPVRMAVGVDSVRMAVSVNSIRMTVGVGSIRMAVGVGSVRMAVSVGSVRMAVSVGSVRMAICYNTICRNTVGTIEHIVLTQIAFDGFNNDVSVCATVAERVDTTATQGSWPFLDFCGNFEIGLIQYD